MLSIKVINKLLRLKNFDLKQYKACKLFIFNLFTLNLLGQISNHNYEKNNNYIHNNIFKVKH